MSTRQIPPRRRGALAVRAERSFVVREVLPVEDFIHSESVAGAILLGAAIVALAWANSPWSSTYFAFWNRVISIDLGVVSITKDLQHWINEGLMTLFFFVVGLEIKRELIHGDLSSLKSAALPAIAAMGGMVVPATIYLALNRTGDTVRGWGIPMATDIAFAIGALAVLGPRIPAGLRIFLLALATVDDLGAILVIALFYTQEVSGAALIVAFFSFLLTAGMVKLGVRHPILYTVAALFFWGAILKSGVHATIAGVALAMLTPAHAWFSQERFAHSADALMKRFREALRRGDSQASEAVLGQFEVLARNTESPLERLERKFHGWSSYLILPLFALANAGVSLSGEQLRSSVAHPVSLGIAMGLVAGKVIGISGFSWVAVRLGLAQLPKGIEWPHLIGAGLLAGIGFTVSLFIASLAFEDAQLIRVAKIGILGASITAGIAGYLWLRAMVLARGAEDNSSA